MEYLTVYSFQKIQHLSPLGASMNLLPNIFIGIILNVTTGLIVHAIRINYLIVLTAIIAAVSPLLMAIIDPGWNYWTCAFWAVLLGPVSVDGMWCRRTTPNAPYAKDF